VQIVPALLFRVYICVSFNWNVHKLGYLQQACIYMFLLVFDILGVTSYSSRSCLQVLNNIDLYETSVDTEVLTQHPQYLTKVLPSWRLQHNVVAVGPTTATYEADGEPFRLVWEHRFYAGRAFNSGAPSIAS
jgi:hypothetical protein